MVGALSRNKRRMNIKSAVSILYILFLSFFTSDDKLPRELCKTTGNFLFFSSLNFFFYWDGVSTSIYRSAFVCLIDRFVKFYL